MRGAGGKVQAERYREDSGCFHDVVFVFDVAVKKKVEIIFGLRKDIIEYTVCL